MVTLRSYFSLFVFLAVMINTAAASPMASIDRSVIAIDDTITFTIRVNGTGSFKGPDLNSIYIDFEVLGNRQSSRHTIRNGVSESWTEWIITLAPKRKGRLTIPAIDVDGEKTQAISVIVRSSPPVSANVIKPVYVESEVDSDSIYVQQQVIFTLRIFQSIQLDNMNITEPEFDDALMEKLGQNSYQRKIQNTPYRVHELQYAIFPQKVGNLIIPELLFTANEAVARRSAFSLPGQGRALRKMSKQHEIEVLPAPIDIKNGSWLPAKDIQLTEKWSRLPDDIRVGDSITRSITVTANGLLDSQLPPFSFASVPGAKLYPDQGNTESSVSARGVTSSRSGSVAIIPTVEGILILPEIQFHWWDTTSKQSKTAAIAATELIIKPALHNTQGASTPLAVDHSQAGKIDMLSSESTAINDNSRFWQIISAIFALAWVVTLLLWWRTAKPAKLPSTSTAKNPNFLSEHNAFSMLNTACKSNDVNKARTTCIEWAKLYWPRHNVNNLHDVMRQADDKELNMELVRMDNILYGIDDSQQSWNGENLLAVIKRIRKNKSKNTAANQQTLPPLYSD
ncbi:MAG: BatD family protein [Oceanicoccus sp.]